jgi:hypothetical protein
MMMMRTVAEWLTPVKSIGIASYIIASVSCAATALRGSNRRVTRLAAILCALDLALLLDIVFDWRWKLYDWLRSGAMSLHWYDERSGVQILALIFFATLLLFAALWLRRKFAPVRGATLAICGGLLSVGCWMTEVISLHAIDAVLYRSAGPLLAVAFVWILASAMTTTGILIARAQPGSNT